MRMACSCVLNEPPLCKEPPVSDAQLFWAWIHLEGEVRWIPLR